MIFPCADMEALSVDLSEGLTGSKTHAKTREPKTVVFVTNGATYKTIEKFCATNPWQNSV